MHWFAFLVPGSKLQDASVLRTEHASNCGSRSPVYEPFVKVRSLSSRDGAGIDQTVVCDSIVSVQEGR